MGGHPFDFTREGAVSSHHLQGQYKQPCIPRSSTSRPGENSFGKYRVWILHLLDHAPLDGCIANLNYSHLKGDQLPILNQLFPPYISLKVDVHKTVALAVSAVVVELLRNLPIHVFDYLEARSIRLITCVQLAL